VKTRTITRIAAAASVFASLALAPQALAAAPVSHDSGASAGAGGVYLSQSSYSVSEDAGQLAITIERTDTSGTQTVGYGVTNVGAESGTTFTSIPNSTATFAPGQSTFTFDVTIHDQGINGPTRFARVYLFGGNPVKASDPKEATISLLQDDALQVRDPTNVLGYAAPTDGDQLQNVQWYTFGSSSPAGAAAAAVAHSNPKWAAALHKLAFTPGVGTYRFWYWNQPASTLAGTVELYLANAEQQQPNTTVPLSTYSLVHGKCESPSKIESSYQNWITQLAKGIGNFRVVLYLEEDSLITTSCLSHAELQVRLKDELAYAVSALAQDPHVLVYLDAGAPDGGPGVKLTAKYLQEADISQAAGFFVNSTHYDWLTTDVHYGQEIAKLDGGAHFVVQSDDDGRGPLKPPHPVTQGNEVLCNPPGRGTGPDTVDTGYKYVDGFLWFNNPGNSGGACVPGAPPTAVFWPAYAVGLVEHGTDKILGPHFSLQKSAVDL